MLWVDATVSRNDSDASDALERSFVIHRYTGLMSIDTEIENVQPAVICFEYDFPTRTGLKLLQRTKQSYPSIPLLMLTVQHSESLAVWAFRTKVWDYLVKPVSRPEMERCIVGLYEMLQMQALQKEPRALAKTRALIPEENRAEGSRGNAALRLAHAAEYVEKHFREKISSSEVARLCNLTPFQFSRAFKETYDLTFQEYVLRYRIREACRLLANPTAEIAEVASLAGFNDPSYFGKMFRRYMSCSPSGFQASRESSLDEDLLTELFEHSARAEN